MKLFKGRMTLLGRGMGYEGPQSHYVLAAWHWRRSITWRWLVWWWPGFKIAPSFYYSRKPGGELSVRFSWVFGNVYFSTQKNMWRPT